MKNIALGLVLALTISTPALASWKSEHFTKLDRDTNGEITAPELAAAGCRFEDKLFIYADKDRSKGLNKAEYFTHREFFRRCN
jgi:hypothetical protein